MMCTKRNRSFRAYLIVLFMVLVVFDLYTLSSATEEAGIVSNQPPYVLRSASSGQICPVRVPEKVSTHAESAQNWENWNKHEGKLLANLFLFCLTFAFLLMLTEGSGIISDSSNIPHIRVLKFIHRKDGKGPEKIS